MSRKKKVGIILGSLGAFLIAILLLVWMFQLYVASLGPGDAKDISAALSNSHGIVVSDTDIIEYGTAIGRDPAVSILVDTPGGAQAYFNTNFPVASYKVTPGGSFLDLGVSLDGWLDKGRLRIISHYENTANPNLFVTLIDDPVRGEVILIEIYDLLEVDLLR